MSSSQTILASRQLQAAVVLPLGGSASLSLQHHPAFILKRSTDRHESGCELNITGNEPLNLSQLTDLLWTGGDLPDRPCDAARAVRAWQALGIHAIIDNRAEWSDEDFVAAFAPKMAYLHVGVDDAGQTMPDHWFDAVARFAIAHIGRGLGVLVHCHMGINRGPSAAFAVLLATGWEPISAIELIRSSRPIAAVGYAEDALDWWHRRAAVDPSERADQRQGLLEWRRANPHDTVRIIRNIERRDIHR